MRSPQCSPRCLRKTRVRITAPELWNGDDTMKFVSMRFSFRTELRFPFCHQASRLGRPGGTRLPMEYLLSTTLENPGVALQQLLISAALLRVESLPGRIS